jgi:hypothetical protein
VKALTLWQPWATLIAIGQKRVETRCWQTSYRGELAIHAAAKMPPLWLGASRHTDQFRNELADVLLCRNTAVESMTRTLPLGSILCIARLHDIQPTERAREILCQRELIFGNYEDGRYAWFLEVIEKFAPIPAKGNRLIWNWHGTLAASHGEAKGSRQGALSR